MRSIEQVTNEINDIETQMSNGDFWNDKEKAQATIKKIKELKDKKEGASAIDKGGAIMSILAGAGGDDSEDFARMLFEMYDAYFSSHNFSKSTSEIVAIICQISLFSIWKVRNE